MELSKEDIEIGMQRLAAISSQFDTATLKRAAGWEAAEQAAQQPWLIAGCSDGMGLHTTLAAIDAGILKNGLGVYWEPPSFLGKNADGTPVSPVHWSRLQNAAALPEYARRKGANFEMLYADVIMAPQRGLKGEIKAPPNALDPKVREAFEPIRAASAEKDVVFVNSVAFGKWMSPREGVEPIAVPTVDFEGRIIEMTTKKYHARGYEETLDTMGRNHGLLLSTLREYGWLGPHALTVFFTWAGGSQNIDVLEGIYGKGALGDAKVVAEQELVAFKLAHGLDQGAHANVRLPAFLSAALMGIPGGGLFGLISQRFLEERGLFEGMPRLSERMLDRMFGPFWIRENPIAQIELDTAECLYIEEISGRVAQAQGRIAKHWGAGAHEPISPETSAQILSGLVPDDYIELLRRFDPTYEPVAAPVQTTPAPVASATLGAGLEFEVEELAARPEAAIVAAVRDAWPELSAKLGDDYVMISESFRLTHAELGRPLTGQVEITNGGEEVTLRRVFDASGVEGTTTFRRGEHAHPHVDADTLGEIIGRPMPVREPLEAVYDGGEMAPVLRGPALVGFARQHLRATGVLEEHDPLEWTIRYGRPVQVGDELSTYARRERDGVVVTVVTQDWEPLLQMTLR